MSVMTNLHAVREISKHLNLETLHGTIVFDVCNQVKADSYDWHHGKTSKAASSAFVVEVLAPSQCATKTARKVTRASGNLVARLQTVYVGKRDQLTAPQ